MTPEQAARLKGLSESVKKTGIEAHIAERTHQQAQRNFDDFLNAIMQANGNAPVAIDKPQGPSAPPSWLASNQ